jgi:hypothetical protein
MADLLAPCVAEIHRKILPGDFDDLAGPEPAMPHPISNVK